MGSISVVRLRWIQVSARVEICSGGTVKDGVIEVQGDHVERVMAALQGLGHKVRRAGG